MTAQITPAAKAYFSIRYLPLGAFDPALANGAEIPPVVWDKEVPAVVEELKKARERGEYSPIFVAAHPGITATSLLDPAKTSHSPVFSRLGHAFLFLFTHSKEKAALTAVYAACKAKNGDCIGPRGLFGISGYPHVTKFCRNVQRQAKHGFDPYI